MLCYEAAVYADAQGEFAINEAHRGLVPIVGLWNPLIAIWSSDVAASPANRGTMLLYPMLRYSIVVPTLSRKQKQAAAANIFYLQY